MKNESKSYMSLGYFNLARGLGMICIILGHTLNLYLKNSGDGVLYSGTGSVFGGGIMAAFFMMSGFGFYRRKPKKCLKIQKKFLLHPYWTVAAAVLITKGLLALVLHRSFRKNGGELLFTYLLGLNAEGGGKVFGIPIESVSIFWFVLALFGGWNIYNGIMYVKSEKIRGILIAGCVILSDLLTKISRVWVFCLPLAFLAAGYLAAGEFVKKKNLLEKKIPAVFWCLILLVITVSAAFGKVNIVACVWRLGLFDIAGTFCVGFVLLRIYAAFMKYERNGKIIELIEKIGFNSIWVVCIHAYEKIIFPWYRVAALFSEHAVLGICICFAARCLVMFVIYKMVCIIMGAWKKRRKKTNWYDKEEKSEKNRKYASGS